MQAKDWADDDHLPPPIPGFPGNLMGPEPIDGQAPGTSGATSSSSSTADKAKDKVELTVHDRLLEKYFETYETPEEVSTIRRNPSRNAKCPCGSGKKFKKCCLIKPKIVSTPA